MIDWLNEWMIQHCKKESERLLPGFWGSQSMNFSAIDFVINTFPLRNNFDNVTALLGLILYIFILLLYHSQIHWGVTYDSTKNNSAI